MAGVKGRSGRKPLSVALHLARGTYRPDRHGPRPAPVVMGAVAPQPRIELPPKAVLDGLAETGLSFVLALWQRYESWTPAQEVVLHEVGAAVDTLNDIGRALTESDQGDVTPNLFPRAARPSAQRILEREPLLRLQNATRRSLVNLLKTLDLPREE